ncbi:MAG: hypothetical protein U1F52_07030 [Burkholderiales bacterium]
MRSAARLVLVLWMSLMLPLQSVAGVLMPFCAGSSDAATSAHGMHGDHAMHADSMSAEASTPAPGGQTAAAPHVAGCDQCGLCHLACAGALPVSAPVLADRLQSVLRPAPQSNVTQFLPDPFLRPPRRQAG